MKFQWQLERYLSVVKKRETMIKAELFDISREIARKQEQIERLREIIAAQLGQMRSLSFDERVARHAMIFAALRAEEDNIDQINLEIKELNAKREEVRQQLMELLQRKKMLEKLREKAKEKFDRKVQLLEQKELDELFQIRFAAGCMKAVGA